YPLKNDALDELERNAATTLSAFVDGEGGAVRAEFEITAIEDKRSHGQSQATWKYGASMGSIAFPSVSTRARGSSRSSRKLSSASSSTIATSRRSRARS